MRLLSPPQVLFFGLALAVGLVLALFPIFPRQLRVHEGDIASRTIRSPREAMFESALLSERAREAAAQAVPDVLVFNPTIRSEQAATLAASLVHVAEVRGAGALDEAAQRAQLLYILPRRGTDTALSLSDERWRQVAREAEQLLDREMSQSIRPDEEQARQAGLLPQIGPDLSADEAGLVVDLLRPLVVATLELDEEATSRARDEARQNIGPVYRSISQGDEIVVEDRAVEATDVEVLEHVGLLAPRLQWDNLAAVALLALLAAVILALYIWLFPTQSITSTRALLLLALIVAAPVLVGKVYFSFVLPEESRWFLAYFLPMAAAPMLLAALLEARLAIVIGMLQAALLAFAVIYLPEDVSLAASIQPVDAGRVLLVYGLSGVVGAYVAHRAERPNQYVLGGLLAGVSALAALFVFWLVDAERLAIDAVWMSAAAAVSGLGSGLLTAGALAAVGAMLGVTTRVQLMELAQLNRPLIRQLQDDAPGTFHHSVIVGNLAERAADQVGADALLVRVGCYYHDIGKALQPGFFIENQLGGHNPHDGMDPKASTRIIAQHVGAGLELAERGGLPQRVQDFIPEHHGTRLIPYFYRMATQQDPNVDPSLFRYPGPKPQSRETAIVMLADSVEATVRASADRSPERIDAIVDEVVAERLSEGELEECDLTLRDIRTVAESFKQTMRGVYHPRIAYPEPTERERRALIGRFRPGRRAAHRAPSGSAPEVGPEGSAESAPQAPSPSRGHPPTW